MQARGRPVFLSSLLAVTVLGVGFVVWPLPKVKAPALPYPTVVVLGAAQYAGRPSPAFQRRLDHALTLYRAGNVQTIVVTGGRRPGDPYSEGEVGRDYLERRGVPPEALLAETRSRTTIENLRGARSFLPPGTPLTLVTDEAHAPRALALSKALDLTANASPSSLRHQPDWRYLLREKMALIAYSLLGMQGSAHGKEAEKS
ncbi:YdcF family protein [Deinococcus sp. Leaf326]|uniref:YdcF family protein n=1 Tax=Deinococcus sp. Leaf326 TaxID=1736338 RepID=UPI0006F86200|nr:YdcF family protein [Deinococcus sp. Leaf326]KQR41237.1 hypothetical protein ASF71_03790 [Deinococcus sp. Leaf326]